MKKVMFTHIMSFLLLYTGSGVVFAQTDILAPSSNPRPQMDERRNATMEERQEERGTRMEERRTAAEQNLGERHQEARDRFEERRAGMLQQHEDMRQRMEARH
ncbi:MAG: hypothetical protein G01um101470_1032, partial [Parcubacteria group bacterium Gr01-1014_70]